LIYSFKLILLIIIFSADSHASARGRGASKLVFKKFLLINLLKEVIYISNFIFILLSYYFVVIPEKFR